MIEALNLSARTANPCGSYAKYKGMRSPLCDCLPCAKKYLEGCQERGLPVRFCRETLL